jgi:hypothetical protein
MKQDEPKWKPGTPGAWATCRYQAGGFWQSAALLYWIKWRCQKPNKIKRKGEEWVVASAAEWAKESGLSDAEFKNTALPILKKEGVIEVKTWKFKGVRQTWIRLIPEALANHINQDYEFYEIRRQSNWYCITTNHHAFSKHPKKKKMDIQ